MSHRAVLLPLFSSCGLSPLTYDMTVPDTRFFFSVILFCVEQTFVISTAAAVVFEDTTRIVYATVVDDLELLLRLVAGVPSASLVLLVHRMEHAGSVFKECVSTWLLLLSCAQSPSRCSVLLLQGELLVWRRFHWKRAGVSLVNAGWPLVRKINGLPVPDDP